MSSVVTHEAAKEYFAAKPETIRLVVLARTALISLTAIPNQSLSRRFCPLGFLSLSPHHDTHYATLIK